MSERDNGTPSPIHQVVAVKPLRWKGPDSSGEYHSLDGLWGYIIRAGHGKIWLTEVGNYFPTVEDAKAAAWEDYERRISAALTSQPAPAEHLMGVKERLSGLISEYFEFGFDEGVEERHCDTSNGAAQNIRSEIDALIASLSAQPATVEQLMGASETLDDLLDQYFGIAYQQGVEGRNHDDIKGSAQETIDKIRACFDQSRRISVTLKAPAEHVANALDTPVGWFNLPHDVHGYQQVAKEFEGHPDTVPLYAKPQITAVDQQTIDHVAAAIDSADVGFSMSLTRLVDGISTYELRMDGNVEEFGDTDDLYARVREIKHRKQAEAVIAAITGGRP